MQQRRKPVPTTPLPASKPEYPMRINRYLAKKGYATRLAADELVKKNRVFINGKLAELGSKVQEDDTVEVKTGKNDSQKKLVYFAFNKPRGTITHSPQKGEMSITDTVPELAQKYNVFPLGRLDKDSHGLIILTNDGRLIERLLSPLSEHDKEYAVTTRLKVTPNFKLHMEQGVHIEDYYTKPAKVALTGEKSFTITLTEGKKHQIRRMVVALKNEVVDLRRVRVLGIRLGRLAPGEYRSIEGAELEEFLKTLGL